MKKVVISMILATLLVTAVAHAHTTEFSEKSLSPDWTTVSTGKSRYNVLNGMLALIAENGYVECTTDALIGDWSIETYVVSTELNDGAFHGLVLDSGVDILCFGRDKNGLKAFTGDKQKREELNTHGIVGEYLQIRKVTKGSDFSTYWFYSSSAERNTVVCVGKYEDIGHKFDNIKYGYYGESTKESNMVYDFFVDTVPENKYDWFSACEVDPIWAVEKRGISICQNGKLVVNISSLADCSDPRIALRYPINQDWIIDTNVTAQSNRNNGVSGLLVYNDNGNYLLLGTGKNNTITSCVCINGKNEFCEYETTGTRLRIAKNENEYTMYTSTDGCTWMMVSKWKDDGSVLCASRVGFGYVGNEAGNIEVQFQYYRENPYPNGAIREITGLTEICREVGNKADNAMNSTSEEYDFYGGDLGILIDAGEKTFMMFGDSFSAPNQKGTWRSNVLAVIEDNSPTDGLSFSRIITNKYGKAKQLIPSKHKDFNDMTSIPTSGIYIDGRLYIHYFNVYHWSVNAHADFNYSGWAYSDDDGETFKTTDPFFDPGSHFMLTSVVRVGNEVYIFGTGSIRFSGVYLAKVDVDKILDRSAYLYYIGKDETGNPCWATSEDNAKEIINGFVGEFSVVYNEWLGRYIITYLNESTLDLEIRDSADLWGEWSLPVTLVDRNVPGYTELVYAPFMLSKFFENNGQTIYFTTSKWTPYSVYWEKATIIPQ